MKIQYLAVIFILIIMPITIVFSEYVDNQITTIETENSYDAKLLNSTYDAIKAYQLNTINNAISDRPDSKIDDIEAAVTTFYNSLVTSFGYDGYNSSVMDDYVPAVVFCMYDGYYIYSPFINTLTEMSDDEVDDDYEDESVLHGLKPYVYYNKRYTSEDDNAVSGYTYDITITYTLDNFITIDGTINGTEVYESGYLVDGITKSGTEDNYTYTYDRISFSESSSERLREVLGAEQYYYTKIDGTKFYLSDEDGVEDSGDEYVFYIDSSGSKVKQVSNDDYNKNRYNLYYNAIMNNIDGYVYYRDAYEFTDYVQTNDVLQNLTGYDGNKIFGSWESYETTGIYIQDSNSNFNEERGQVIRNVIQTNLVTAISAFGNYGDSSIEYIMPEISDTDWDLIINNVCVATFLQGMDIGGKVYNSYSVVANNLTKEYVDENDIYISLSDNTYTKVNDKGLVTSPYAVSGPGILKLNFERRVYKTEDSNEVYYYPKSYWDSTAKKYISYMGSYTGIIAGSTLYDISKIDMYRYMRNVISGIRGADATDVSRVKKYYYTALGRERTQAYNVQNGLGEDAYYTINDVEIENWYYLVNYYDESAVIEESEEDTVEISDAVAQNVDTGIYYSSLESAILDIADSTSTNIKLLKDTVETISVESGKIINLDLNNYTLSSDSSPTLTNNGTLTISGGTISNGSGVTISNKGTLKIKSGTITNTLSGASTYTILNKGDVVMSGGDVGKTGDGWTVYNQSGTYTMEGGNIHLDYYGDGSAIMNRSIFNISSGSIASDGYGLVTRGEGAISTITGGTFSTSNESRTAIRADEEGIVYISDSEIYGASSASVAIELERHNGSYGKLVVLRNTNIITGNVKNYSTTVSDAIIEIQDTSEGYFVAYYDSEAIRDAVYFPTWTTSDGQDDLIWHQGTIGTRYGSRVFCYYVKKSEHNDETGEYNTNVYINDTIDSNFVYGFTYTK